MFIGKTLECKHFSFLFYWTFTHLASVIILLGCNGCCSLIQCKLLKTVLLNSLLQSINCVPLLHSTVLMVVCITVCFSVSQLICVALGFTRMSQWELEFLSSTHVNMSLIDLIRHLCFLCYHFTTLKLESCQSCFLWICPIKLILYSSSVICVCGYQCSYLYVSKTL